MKARSPLFCRGKDITLSLRLPKLNPLIFKQNFLVTAGRIIDGYFEVKNSFGYSFSAMYAGSFALRFPQLLLFSTIPTALLQSCDHKYVWAHMNTHIAHFLAYFNAHVFHLKAEKIFMSTKIWKSLEPEQKMDPLRLKVIGLGILFFRTIGFRR